MKPVYEITVGSLKVNNKGESQRDLLSLNSHLTMSESSNLCMLELSGGKDPVKPEDKVEITLGNSESKYKVFTGYILKVEKRESREIITAVDDLHKLKYINHEAAYQDVDCKAVVEDILSKAKIKSAKIDKGPKLGSYYIRKNPKADYQLRQLAESAGADVYCDAEGKVNFRQHPLKSTEHSFEAITDYNFSTDLMPYDSVLAYGEGAASLEGAKKAHWLLGDLDSVCGKAKIDDKGKVTAGSLGQNTKAFSHGALRSGQAAEDSATAQAELIASKMIRGYIELSGCPQVQLGDSVKIAEWAEGLPKKSLTVRCLIHSFTKAGFTSRVEF